MSTLQVWTDGTDTVVAADLADVRRVIEEQYGSWESSDDNWRRISDDKPIRIHADDHTHVVTKTAREWAESDGRGLLCSTEY